MSTSNSLNPEIREWSFGIRETVNIEVYPLSISGQTKLLSEAYNGFIDLLKKQGEFKDNDEDTNKKVIEEILDFLLSNIEELSELVLDEKVDFDKCTNGQLSALAMIIYEVNYEGPVKNAGTLMEKLKSLFFQK